MEWIVDHLYIVLVACSLVLNVVIYLVTHFAGNKKTKLLKALTAVQNALPEIITIAEKVGANGEDRKTFAMGQVKIMCQALGLTPTEDQLKVFSDTIDNLVGLTKAINTPTTPANKITTLGVK